MSLRYDDRWTWDFWVAIDGPDVHLFHLQAPRPLGDPMPLRATPDGILSLGPAMSDAGRS